MSSRFDVVVVMPVYNEQDGIAKVIGDWLGLQERLGIRLQLLVLDDGSRDNTGKVLDALPADPRLTIVHKPNSGHGPTILAGYHRAVAEAEWVFQTDSDDEIPAGQFADLWAAREGVDAVFGYRVGRQQSLPRAFVSGVSRLLLGANRPGRVRDPNCPFRLLRASVLREAIALIPPDTFAPNILLAWYFQTYRTITSLPCQTQPRPHGAPALSDFKILRRGVTSYWQLRAFRRQHRR